MRGLTLAFLAMAAWGHSYHSSIAQLDSISAKKTAEVMLFLHTEDIEQAFHAQVGANANFDDPTAAEKFVRDYLKSYFILRDKRSVPLPQHWVGMEVKVHFLTVYLEFPLADGWEGVTLENRILLQRVPGQLNSVQVKQDGKPRNELQFTLSAAGAKPLTPP